MGPRLSLRCTAHIGQVMMAIPKSNLNLQCVYSHEDGNVNFASTRCTRPQHLAEQLWCQGAPHLHLQEEELCQNLEEAKKTMRMCLESPCWPLPMLTTTAPGRPTPPSLPVFSSSSFFSFLQLLQGPLSRCDICIIVGFNLKEIYEIKPQSCS